jgi:hypothetical protein
MSVRRIGAFPYYMFSGLQGFSTRAVNVLGGYESIVVLAGATVAHAALVQAAVQLSLLV